MSDKRYLGNIITPTPTEPAGSFQDDTASGTWSLQEAFTYVKAGLWPTAGNQKPLIEDVFSTYLYTGNGSTQTITNGIDLAGEGGLVWIKSRTTVAFPVLHDTERGALKYLTTNTTDAEGTDTNSVTSFNADGFSMGGDTWTNFSGANFASWTFRKAPRFFDVVTYTGDGAATKTISHNLGMEPGCIIVKNATTSGWEWYVYHRSLPLAGGNTPYYLYLNDTSAQIIPSFGQVFNSVPTETSFEVGTNDAVNASGATYVAYLFAHDPLGPSGDGSDGLIACGSFTTDGSGNASVDLGWEPQFTLIKSATSVRDWRIADTMRGFTATNGASPTNTGAWLTPNTSGAEITTSGSQQLNATGFEVSGQSASDTYIYIAIRRGPMRQPTSGTEVFDAELFTSASTVFQPDFPPDMNLHLFNRSVGGGVYNGSRMAGNSAFLVTSSTGAEGSSAGSWKYDGPTGTFAQGLSSGTSPGGIQWMFRRAPGFFDVVAYTGNGVAGRTVPHNLGVAPELILGKRRNLDRPWIVYNSTITAANFLELNNDIASTADLFSVWNGTEPTSENFTVGTNQSVNSSGDTYIAYLFATLPGVSKVGSYTGNGTSQTIDCGFTSGARFVLIKRTDNTGDWYVWDSARGIVAGNDPHLSLNTTAAEVTTDDSVDADSSGFIVNQDAATNVNVSSASYIFLAIA